VTDERKLMEVLAAIYERRSGEINVSPSWLATEAMAELDPERNAPDLVYRAAHLQLRQVARSICRRKFEEDGADQEQHDLFPQLQRRYPAAHSTDIEPVYVLLEHVTEADVMFNLRRLRSEADTKLRHADAFEAWWQEKISRAA